MEPNASVLISAPDLCETALACESFDTLPLDAFPGGVWTVTPVFSRVDVGWESYQPDTERAIWVDDFVLGAARLGCPAP